MNGIFNLDGVGKGKSFQDIIDEMTIDECIDGIKCLDICCNRAEIVREKAIQALREKLEWENPQPLGLEELGNMSGEPYFHISLNGNKNEWVILDKHISEHPQDYNYGKTWLAYRYKPDSVDANKIEYIGEATNMVEGEE